MDFNNVEIPKILKSAIRLRFQDFSPFDFEDFIGQFFKDKGYIVTQTSYSGDFGADIIIEKDNEKTAVQVKRYKISNTVGVGDINQVLGAKDYYKCNNSLVITTSSFTKQGIILAKKTDTLLWDWKLLLKEISDVYFDGLDYYSYYKDKNVQDANDNFAITIKNFKTRVNLTNKGTFGSIITIEVVNISNDNLTLEVNLPTLITKDFEQIECDYRVMSSFIQGTIYAGCKVEIGYIFLRNKVPTLNDGDKIISKFVENVSNSESIEKNYITIYGAIRAESEIDNYHDAKINTLLKTIDELDAKIKDLSFELSNTNDSKEDLEYSLRKKDNIVLYLLGIIGLFLVLVFYLFNN